MCQRSYSRNVINLKMSVGQLSLLLPTPFFTTKNILELILVISIYFQEVHKLSFVGDRLAKKIIEILETGYLRRLDHMRPNIDVINLFADVWGAGPKTAEAWVAKVGPSSSYFFLLNL